MKTTTWFSAKLERALAQQDLSVRAAAKRWRPANPESARRSLIRYLQGDVLPQPEMCAEIAAAIGVDAQELLPDEDEEADPLTMLMASVRALVRESVAEALRDERGELVLR